MHICELTSSNALNCQPKNNIIEEIREPVSGDKLLATPFKIHTPYVEDFGNMFNRGSVHFKCMKLLLKSAHLFS